MKRTVIGGVAIIIVLAAAATAYVATRNKAVAPAVTPQQAEKSAGIPVAGMSVVFDGESFSPAKLTLQSGQTITFSNTSSRNVQPSSDPHPSHTKNTELNVGVIAPGQTKTITVTKTGTWGYHDHLNEELVGTVVVE